MTAIRTLPTKALSIRQPWAWLIVNGHKDIENRSWATKHRGPTLIHAAKGMTQGEFADACYFARNLGVDVDTLMPSPFELQRGGIVGIATITGCTPSRDRTSRWHMEGQHGFWLEEAMPLPITPLAGRLGFFDVPADVLDRIIQNQ